MRLVRRVGYLVAVAAIIVAASAATARAQASQTAGTSADEGFTPTFVDVGPVIGLGALGEANVSVGGRFEYAFLQLPNFPQGILSVGGGVDHYSYDLVGYHFSYTPIGVTVNFHYRLENKKIDPFAGFGLGDYVVSTPNNFIGSYNSGIYPIARIGIRYFWQPNLALFADAGAGAGALHVGIMFKLRS